MTAAVVETAAVVMAGIKPSMIVVATGIVVMVVIATMMVMMNTFIHAGIRETNIARTSG